MLFVARKHYLGMILSLMRLTKAIANQAVAGWIGSSGISAQAMNDRH